VLIGLLANATLGWWWADPVAALVIAAREGVEAWRGEQCDDCALPVAVGGEADGRGCGPGCAEACCTGTQQADR